MKNIAEKLNQAVDTESGERKLTPHAVGRINRNYLRLRTRRVGGRYKIIWDAEKIRKLCSRYGIEFPYERKEDDDVVAVAEKIFGAKAEDITDESPKSTESPSRQVR